MSLMASYIANYLDKSTGESQPAVLRSLKFIPEDISPPSSPIGAIVGGVIGGLIALSLITAFSIMWVKKIGIFKPKVLTSTAKATSDQPSSA